MRMVNGGLSLSLYQGQDSTFLHTNTPSESSTVATGWLFFSIALGSLFTFTFFAALSTSFYCCEKTRREDPDETDQGFFSEGHSEQKLFFPKVPSSVYPTTHSILQQEENEVVESLSPAYRELPSTHLTYPSSFDTTSVEQTFFGSNKSSAEHHLTIFPNSTQSSCKYNTTSLSSERLENTASDPNRSAVISIPDYTCDPLPSHSAPDYTCDPLRSQSAPDYTCDPLRSQSAPGLQNDSSLSIRVASCQNPEACMTSSTSGILTGDDLMTQTFEERTTLPKNPSRLPESALSEIISGQRPSRLPEPALSEIISGQRVGKDGQNNLSKELWDKLLKEQIPSGGDEHYRCYATRAPICLPSGERRCRSSGWELPTRGKPQDQTRSYSEGRLLRPEDCRLGVAAESVRLVSDKQKAKTCGDSHGVCEDKITPNKDNFKKNPMIDDNTRGASSFGEDSTLSNPSAASLSKYYALTFRREASILSDKSESNSSLRGASAFVCRSKEAGSETLPRARRGVAPERIESRGASAFGMKSDLRSQQGTPCPEGNEEKAEQLGVEMISKLSLKTLCLNGDKTRPDSQKYHIPPKPITNMEYEPRDYEEPMSVAQTMENNLNTTYQCPGSVRGASELGDQDSAVGRSYDIDTLCESVSLSFAYDSSSDDDMTSHFMLKEH